MFKASGKAYTVNCYCKVCHKEFEIEIIHLVRDGCYCEECLDVLRKKDDSTKPAES